MTCRYCLRLNSNRSDNDPTDICPACQRALDEPEDMDYPTDEELQEMEAS